MSPATAATTPRPVRIRPPFIRLVRTKRAGAAPARPAAAERAS